MSTATARTLAWIHGVVVGLNLCPFAAGPLRRKQVLFVECDADTAEQAFYRAGSQVQSLVEQPPNVVETSLLIFTSPPFTDFAQFLDFVGEVEAFLTDTGANALVQLAHFHPHYCFAGVPADDPANATNQSPYPTLQLLRIASVAKAVAAHPDPEGIPERNARLLREQPDLIASRRDD
ncbi:DUF1415 family protein [Neolewinella sp.]|uniref:DUF1415 family protein n=1 Tax=Neolewinella sp. TaxID=2993543 RepID=UPI003B51FC2C